jgi:uncharacterized protein YbaR (Trm112 family)
MLEDVIACPNPDHGSLVATDGGYTCTACGATFEVRNGIPVLLPTPTSEA